MPQACSIYVLTGHNPKFKLTQHSLFMKPQTSLLTLFLFVSAVFSTITLSAQQNPTVQMTGAKMRAPLDLPQGNNTVALCDLIPGNTYLVIANGAAAGQVADFEIAASAASLNTVKDIVFQEDRKNVLRFTALSACVDLQVTAQTSQQVTALPMFLSVKCETCPEVNAWKEKLSGKSAMSVLEVSPGVSADDLIRNVLIGGNCYDVSNVTFSGQGSQIGTFSNGLTNIGFSEGMILATGSAEVAVGPNDSNNASGGYGNSTPDANLSSLTAGSIYDRANIEFDFTPTQTPVTFEFVFASEEYCEYVNSQFNDVFGFFISGPGITGTQNLAVIGPSTPVSINTVNHLINSGLYVHNTPFSGNNCNVIPPAMSPAINEVQYDGFTQKLTAVANVTPCQTYHIKLKIADVGDGIFDSGVFLRANSFEAGGSVVAETVYPAGIQHVYENCDTGYVRFIRGNGDNSQPLTVNFAVSGISTATPGADYEPLASPAVIPAGQNEILIPVLVWSDTLQEGQENIILLLDNSCACSQTQVEFLIQDNIPAEVSLDDQTACSNIGSVLSPVVSGGVSPYSYLWSTGDTTSSIHVTPTGTTLYSVIVTDQCGQAAADSALVQVQLLIEDSVFVSFCPGSTVVIGDSTYTQSGVVIITLQGQGGACDTITTYVVELLPLTAFTDTIVFCTGSSVTVNGTVYSAPGIATDTLPGQNGACDTIATYVLQVLPKLTQTVPLSFCPGGSITIGGTVYTAPGTVTVMIPGLNGHCDTIITYELSVLPQATLAQTITFCPGETVVLGGTAYTGPGTVVLTKPGTNNDCDTIVTYTLQLLTPAPSTVKAVCPNAIVMPGGTQTVVHYDLPSATTDCTCPGIALTLTEGLPSGNTFLPGTTKVCYTATDSCGQTTSCCFDIKIPTAPPCDVKTIACIKYELLSIQKDSVNNKTYRIRVTNNCTNKLIYAAFQLPNGVVALDPPNNSVYTAPSGREYDVLNPNHSPFHSIRFKTSTDSISNGESDIFEFTLPPYTNMAYIHVIVRVAPKIFYEAHLNTFNCPEVSTPVQKGAAGVDVKVATGFTVFPNPSSGTLFADLTAWTGEQVDVRVFDSRGQRIQFLTLIADAAPQELHFPQDLADGLYFLEIATQSGGKEAVRFVVRR